MSVVARLATLADEAASINHTGSPIRMLMQLKPFARPQWRKRGQKARFSPLAIQAASLLFRCSSAQDAHPEEGEVEMAIETQAVLVVPDEDAPGETHPDENVEAPNPEQEESPSVASLGENPLVSGFRGMAQQHDLFTDLLRTTDYMRVFATRRKDSENQLRLRLEEAEASLFTAREDNEALRVDLAEVKSREESTSSTCMRQRMRWPG
ncbi:hypothetical protein CK203_026039 [Vitis vinifera]|uniref:Uncharacterized protein n=1 Tax=Vitis vinifera TaxID=29760 RepID=A0A438IJ73_VITVI|nr:hypothetical protein CK203_026039 [Vitis vinifera]